MGILRLGWSDIWKMVINEIAKKMLAARRERRRLIAMGYLPHETNPEITRGGRRNEVIVDAIISVDGKYVYTKIGRPGPDGSGQTAATG
jgi:hypothetical protein